MSEQSTTSGKKFAPLNLSKEEIINYTPEWEGERFADGRPKVSDDIIERMKPVTVEEAWGMLRGEGYEWQYEGGWECTEPGTPLVGRAVTAVYMPRREVMRELIWDQAHEAGCVGGQVSWPIDTLVQGDVYVADVFGRIADGPVVGSNLSTSVFAKTGNGVVHDAAVRDLEKVKQIEGFNGFFRGYHPSAASSTIMLMGINTPVRIGEVTVMPGDVILGKDEGVVVIPPHLAEKVVVTSEIVRLRDTFGEIRLKEGVYTPGEIDRRWTDNIEEDFAQWVEAHIDELPVPRETMQEYLKTRTW